MIKNEVISRLKEEIEVPGDVDSWGIAEDPARMFDVYLAIGFSESDEPVVAYIVYGPESREMEAWDGDFDFEMVDDPREAYEEYGRDLIMMESEGDLVEQGSRFNTAPIDSSWTEFAEYWDIGTLDLDKFGSLLGFDGWKDLDMSIDPFALYQKNPGAFEDALRDSSIMAKNVSSEEIRDSIEVTTPKRFSEDFEGSDFSSWNPREKAVGMLIVEIMDDWAPGFSTERERDEAKGNLLVNESEVGYEGRAFEASTEFVDEETEETRAPSWHITIEEEIL